MFQVLPVNDFNLDDPRLEYDNVIPVPEIFVPGFTSKKPYNIWYGSRFSAKSWTKATQYLLNASNPDYFRAVFARMTQKAARDSQFQLFRDLMKRYPLLGDQFNVNKTEMLITHKTNGNFIKGGSFEQPESLMSVPELTNIWVEEPISRRKSLGKSAFEDMAGTLRNDRGIIPQFDMTFNPIVKSNFIFEDFFDEPKFDSHIIKANYYDNPFCPQDRIDFLDNMKISNPTRYAVDGQGNWGNVMTGFEYYGMFNRVPNVETARIRKLPIHITFDFNVMPYMSCIVNQVYMDKLTGKVVFHAIREYCLKPPHSTVKATVNAMLRDWEPHIKQYGCFVYGDASGNNRIPSSEVRTLYGDVQKHMRGYMAARNKRVSRSNRKHVIVSADGSIGRYELMQKLMSGFEPYMYRVDPKCEKLIEDYESVQIDANGGKSKKKVKVDGVQFEKWGHTSDAQDYFLSWQLKYQFNL